MHARPLSLALFTGFAALTVSACGSPATSQKADAVGDSAADINPDVFGETESPKVLTLADLSPAAQKLRAAASRFAESATIFPRAAGSSIPIAGRVSAWKTHRHFVAIAPENL